MLPCVDCTPVGILARQLNVRPGVLYDLVKSGKIDTHRHGSRTMITAESASDIRWRLAVAKADAA